MWMPLEPTDKESSVTSEPCVASPGILEMVWSGCQRALDGVRAVLCGAYTVLGTVLWGENDFISVGDRASWASSLGGALLC